MFECFVASLSDFLPSRESEGDELTYVIGEEEPHARISKNRGRGCVQL